MTAEDLKEKSQSSIKIDPNLKISFTAPVGKRWDHTSVLVKDRYILTIGGLHTEGTSYCDAYDTVKDRWIVIDELP